MIFDRKAHDHEYYLKNKEVIRKRADEWRKNNKDRVAIIQKRHYQSLPCLVYRWVSPKGFTAYVGRGTIRRALAHRKTSSWYEEDMQLKTLVARNEWHAMALEGLWGELFRPVFNREGYRH